jgi:hypothetical protein
MMDLFQHAELERDRGMVSAALHAAETHERWNDRAYAFLVEYARKHQSFISEDVSDASIDAGFPQPPTLRAWGVVYVKAIKNDVIIQTGAGRSRRRHASICPRWGSLVAMSEMSA